MADIATIKKLRDETGHSIAKCKEALEESGGDMDKAREVLREKGAIAAQKKADRDSRIRCNTIIHTHYKSNRHYG